MGIRRIPPLGHNPVFKKKVYPQSNHRSRTKECKDIKNDPERNDRVNYMITCKKDKNSTAQSPSTGRNIGY